MAGTDDWQQFQKSRGPMPPLEIGLSGDDMDALGITEKDTLAITSAPSEHERNRMLTDLGLEWRYSRRKGKWKQYAYRPDADVFCRHIARAYYPYRCLECGKIFED